MSRLFLMVFVAGMLCIAQTASADVPNCSCLNDWAKTWEVAPDNCLFVCPGDVALGGHGAGTLTDNQLTLYVDDLCTTGLEGFSGMRIDLGSIFPDSICVCDDATTTDFPYLYPLAATDANGRAYFRFRGSILQMENTEPDDVAWLEVEGCQRVPVRFRSTDLNADCTVGSADISIFASAAVGTMCRTTSPTGYQHYTIFQVHCAPCAFPGSADISVFALHASPANPPHTCTPAAYDP